MALFLTMIYFKDYAMCSYLDLFVDNWRSYDTSQGIKRLVNRIESELMVVHLEYKYNDDGSADIIYGYY